MSLNENTCWEPGALVQIKKNVHGAGELGVVIGPTAGVLWNGGGRLDVLFSKGTARSPPKQPPGPQRPRPRGPDDPPR